MVDIDFGYDCHFVTSLCLLVRMMINKMPAEIICMICKYLPLQDVKNVSLILPEIYLTSVFKNWSKLHNNLNYIQEQINMIKCKLKLKHLYENDVSGNISPKKFFLHIMVTDQNWFQCSSPFYVKQTLNYMMRLLNDVLVYHDIVNNYK